MKNIAIILAAGSGERLPGAVPKQFLEIGGKTLLALCLERFQEHPGIDGIVLVCPADRLPLAEKTVTDFRFTKVLSLLAGGPTRQESSAIGVHAASGAVNVLIHDAARALVPGTAIRRVLAALASASAVMPVLAAGDTTVRVDDAGMVTAVLDREKLRRVQTPQGFKLETIHLAHELAQREGFTGASDDCSLVLRYKLAPVVTVDGDAENIKVTIPLDLVIAKAILSERLKVKSE